MTNDSPPHVFVTSPISDIVAMHDQNTAKPMLLISECRYNQ